MPKAPWIRWYWSDWIADTAHLGHTEKGIYIALLEQYYQHRQPLPDDFEKLCRIVRILTPEERRACTDVLSQFFFLDTSTPTRCWRHHRADLEIERADEKYDTRVLNVAKARAALQHQRQESDQQSAQESAGEPEPEESNTSASRSRPKTLLPPNFSISPAVASWAAEHSIPSSDLLRHLEHFTDTALAKAYRYASWDRAFIRAIRDNWAGLKSRNSLI